MENFAVFYWKEEPRNSAKQFKLLGRLAAFTQSAILIVQNYLQRFQFRILEWFSITEYAQKTIIFYSGKIAFI